MAFDFLKRRSLAAPEEKASAAGPVIAYAGSGRVAWSPRDTKSLTRSGFAGNPVGFRAVKLIAEAAAAIPLVLQDAEMRYETHPLLTLLARPNPGQARAELLEALYGQVLLSGDGYVEAVLDEAGVPFELHVLRSDRMSVVPGADGWPVAFEYAVGGRTHRFAVTDGLSTVCHVKAFHPQNDHYGLSPLQSAAAALDVHNAASAWSKALLDNAARPSGAIVYSGPEGHDVMTPEQYDRVQIAMAFGVPPMLLGIPGDATYANYQEANRAFYRLTVLPLVQKVTGAISHWLTGFTGDVVVFKPDLDQVPALAVEREGQWKRVSDAAFLSDAEKRALLGLPKNQED